MTILSVNPATGDVLQSFNAYRWEDVSAIIGNTAAAQKDWKCTKIEKRAELMKAAASVLRENKDEFARIMTLEMGKPVVQSAAEVEKCAWVCDYYAEEAQRFLSPELVSTDASSSYVRFDPLGTVLAVMPWNFPFWQVFRFAAPALMAGNAGLLKHASNVPQCALAIEDVFRKAGFPEHIFRTLLIGSGLVDNVLEHDAVVAATLTGSDPAGRAVAMKCGSVLKKSVLELGGSDPFIVFDDANLDVCVPAAVTARLINTGQSCIAAKRFIVTKGVYEEFVDRYIVEMQSRIMGDPLEQTTEVGAMARQDLVDELHEQVIKSLEQGAVLKLGGCEPEGPGAFYPPTVLADVRPGMTAFDEETFGPVAAIIRAEDTEDAIELANNSEFGLGACIWTGDTGKAALLAEQIEAGCVFVNSMVKSDPRLPFGGIKLSGYGRELAGFGIREFVNIKTVWVE